MAFGKAKKRLRNKQINAQKKSFSDTVSEMEDEKLYTLTRHGKPVLGGKAMPGSYWKGLMKNTHRKSGER